MVSEIPASAAPPSAAVVQEQPLPPALEAHVAAAYGAKPGATRLLCQEGV